MRVRVRVIGLAALVLLGCETSYRMLARNVDGPDVVLWINDERIAALSCGTGQVMLQPGRNAPVLPWRVELIDVDGDTYGTSAIDGSHGPQQDLLIRDIGVIEVPPADRESAEYPSIGCAR